MNRHTLIRLGLEGLAAARAPHWLPVAPDAAGVAITLHHVRPRRPAAFEPNALLSITPEFLDELISYLSARGWRFVTVDELIAGPAPAGARRIAVTLDDGYRDNLEYALPVFRRHAVPLTIYVCTGFSDRRAELWWEALERIIDGADMLPSPGGGSTLNTRSVTEKYRAFRIWTHWLTRVADEAEQRRAVRELAAVHGVDLVALLVELVMDFDEVRKIAADPLCTVGAHTMTHAALAHLPAHAALREMTESADRIAAEIGVRPSTIAFPYGYPAAAGAREAALAEQAGFSASFTTQPGTIKRSGSRHGLPRISVNGLFQELRYLDVLLTPGLWTMRDRIRRLARAPAGPASASRR